MDKHQRLTAEREWELGAVYRYKKGGRLEVAHTYTCTEIRLSHAQLGGWSEPGYILLRRSDTGNEIKYYGGQWRNRFVKV